MTMSAFYMFISALSFALMSGCVKAVSLGGIPVMEILAARALVSSVLSYADIKRKGISPWGHNHRLLIARGVVGTMALMCFFYAITVLPLAEVTLLQYLNPVFTSIFALLFIGERIQRSTSVCILLSLIGLVFMVQPQFLFGSLQVDVQPLPTFGVVAALMGAFGAGAAYVLVRQLNKTEDPSVIIFYFPFIALPVSLLLLGDDFVMPHDLDTWILLLLVGIFTQIGQYCLTVAMKREKAAKAMAFSYVQVLFSAAIGWVFFSEVPGYTAFIGTLFIVGGAIVNLYPQLKRRQRLSTC
jgi:drug/metabolite transporter (DMT)-like permease